MQLMMLPYDRATAVLVVTFILVTFSAEGVNHAPKLVGLDKEHREVRAFHGIIKESETVVDLDPALQASDLDNGHDGEICGYKLYPSHKGILPFTVRVTNPDTGAAQVEVKEGHSLNFNKRRKYKFEIAAVDCGTPAKTSEDRMVVHINVEDVDDHEPVWDSDDFEIIKVPENQLVEEIVSIKAHDDDTSPQYKSICNYQILTPNVPFSINKQGVIRNTEKLHYGVQNSYILEVKAEDCGHKLSKPLRINIEVQQTCKPGWKDVEERVLYTPSTGVVKLFPRASLSMCKERCQKEKVEARVKLQTKHIGKGCDRDTYSIQSQRRLCGANDGVIDLLPSPHLSPWTKKLPTDDGHASDRIFAFDGKTNAEEVPKGKIDQSLTKHFTMMMWMRHEEDVLDTTPHGRKETILCNSDGEGMDRHHYSLFVHKCRLVLLVRREYTAEEYNVFKPAEWRWKLPQVCDDEWHHYAISVDSPKVRLFVDGKLVVEQKNNPEIIDDWPLHKTKKVHFAKLVVGASWQGKEKRLTQFFRGYLAGLSILRGKTESDRVIKCLNSCQEKLDFHALDKMQTGESIMYDSEMTEITFKGHNVSEIMDLVREVGYVNSRLFPTPGFRNLEITTKITCLDNVEIKLPVVDSMVVVQEARKPTITITGHGSVRDEEHAFVHGKRIFKDVNIVSRILDDEEAESEEEDNNEIQTGYTFDQLDACVISVSPALSDEETLDWPTMLVSDKGLDVTASDTGLTIAGSDKIYNYEDVLRLVHYANKQPEKYNSKTFTVKCTEQDGRFESNEFKVKVDIIHREPEQEPIKAAAEANSIHHDVGKPLPPNAKFTGKELNLESNNVANVAAAGGASAGMTVIIVVCVGFLAFMIILGVIRIRAAHKKTQIVKVEESTEMEWDNSALTITVNPLEEGTQNPYDAEELQLQGDDSDSDDDDVSSYHDELESSEDESEKIKDRELEWDDSTMSY